MIKACKDPLSGLFRTFIFHGNYYVSFLVIAFSLPEVSFDRAFIMGTQLRTSLSFSL